MTVPLVGLELKYVTFFLSLSCVRLDTDLVCVDVSVLQARAELSGVAYYMLIVVNYRC